MRPEILYYNTHAVSDLIKKQHVGVQPFLSETFSETLFNKYEKFGLNKHNMIYDRTQSIQHYLNVYPMHTIPKIKQSFNLSFYEVAVKRAKELLSLNKPIYVLWSGGIDSTLILLLLQSLANDKSQVRIYGTYNSIIESGDMFDRRLKKEFLYHIAVPTENEYSYQFKECIFVSGMCGNQLFGPADDFFSNTPNALFHHTLGTSETIYESYENNVDQELLEFLDPMIKKSERKIETIADLRWYCIFNLDWYTALYEHRTQVPADDASRIVGFFNSEDFQQWALTTKEPFTKVKGDPTTHRWQMREILSSLGEDHYAKHKTKKISIFNVNNPHWLFLLRGYRNVLDD